MKKIVFKLLIVFIIFSCEKEVEIPIEQTKSKLVVNALFKTNSLWNIELSTSKYIYDNSSILFIDNALVSITNSANNIINLINQGNGIYSSTSETPQKGETYTLNITHDDYDNVNSTNQLPNEPVITKIEWSNNVVLGQDENYRKINLTFKDSPSKDFYSISIKGASWEKNKDIFTGKTDSTLIISQMYFSTENAVSGNNNKNHNRGIINFNDDLFNGKEYTFDILLPEYYFSYEDYNDYDDKYEKIETEYEESFTNTIYISLNKISEEYYWYITSYQAYLNSQNGMFTQPVQVYTNIENGHGIFAGFSTDMDSIKVR